MFFCWFFLSSVTPSTRVPRARSFARVPGPAGLGPRPKIQLAQGAEDPWEARKARVDPWGRESSSDPSKVKGASGSELRFLQSLGGFGDRSQGSTAVTVVRAVFDQSSFQHACPRWCQLLVAITALQL